MVVGFVLSVSLFVVGCLGLLVTIAFVGICWSRPAEPAEPELQIAGGTIVLGDLDLAFGVRSAQEVFDDVAIDVRTPAQSDERSVVLNAKTETLLLIEADEREELMAHLTNSFVQSSEDDSTQLGYEPPLLEQIKLDLVYPMAVIVLLMVVVVALGALVL